MGHERWGTDISKRTPEDYALLVGGIRATEEQTTCKNNLRLAKTLLVQDSSGTY
jgi:hypothetical protein